MNRSVGWKANSCCLCTSLVPSVAKQRIFYTWDSKIEKRLHSITLGILYKVIIRLRLIANCNIESDMY